MVRRFRPYVACPECDFLDYEFTDYKDGQDCPECETGTLYLAAPA